MSLLEEAKLCPVTQLSYTDEDEELVLGYLTGDVSLQQVQRVKRFKDARRTYAYVSIVARKFFSRDGIQHRRPKKGHDEATN